MIKSAFRPDTEEIHWYCPDCENDGLINGWQQMNGITDKIIRKKNLNLKPDV